MTLSYLPSLTSPDQVHHLPADSTTDALVALHVMGWRYSSRNDQRPTYHWQWETFPNTWINTPHFSTEIAFAMMAADHILNLLSTPGPLGGAREAKLTLYITHVRSAGYDYLYHQAYIGNDRSKPKRQASSLADSPSLAICRTALLITLFT